MRLCMTQGLESVDTHEGDICLIEFLLAYLALMIAGIHLVLFEAGSGAMHTPIEVAFSRIRFLLLA